MIDEELLHSLAEGTDLESGPPILAIRQRGHQIRRRRRQYAAGVGAVLVVAAVAVPMLIQDPRTTSVSVVPTQNPLRQIPADGRDDQGLVFCGIGVDDPTSDEVDTDGGWDGPELSLAAATPVLFLPPPGVTGDLISPVKLTQWSGLNCSAPPPGVSWYAMDGDVVSRMVYLRGPGMPLTLDRWKNAAPPVDLASGAGRMGFDKLPQTGFVEWRVSGQVWSAKTFGLSKDAALAALDTLRFRESQLDTSQAPAGFTTRSATLGGRPESSLFPQLHAAFGRPLSEHTSKAETTLTVTEMGNVYFGPPGKGARAVTINGRPGWLSGHAISWQIADGVKAEFTDSTGTASAGRLIQIAEATVPVSADDPRLHLPEPTYQAGDVIIGNDFPQPPSDGPL